MDANLWTPDLRQLITLLEVADAGSFGRAAERLGYTQSAVSQQIAALEALVGERLVERSRGVSSVTLTEAGRLLARHAEAIVARLHAAQADFAEFAAGAVGQLRIGTFESAGTRILPSLLRTFTATWPRVEVQLTEHPSDQSLFAMVESGDLDLAFGMLPLPDGPFESVSLLRDPYVLVTAKDSPLAEVGDDEWLAELAEVGIVTPQFCRTAQSLDEYLRGRGIEPRVVFRSDNNGTVQGMVAAGVGVALMPRLAVDERDRRVVVRPVEADVVPPRTICLVWHRDRYRSPAARAFVEAAAHCCEAVAAEIAAPLQRTLQPT